VKLLVGLGNPGSRHRATRHNAGRRIAERFAAAHGIALCERRFRGRYGEGRVGPHPVGVLAPETFMNVSGEAVAEARDALALAPADLLLAFDDLDLPLGRIRLRAAGGAGGHRGLASVIEMLGTRAFPRLRFGIGRPPSGQDPVDYVLTPFSAAEEEVVAERLPVAVEAVDAAFCEGLGPAMCRFNAAPSGVV
jgi:PTH1 family peptidyl-tRNA hydrolase